MKAIGSVVLFLLIAALGVVAWELVGGDFNLAVGAVLGAIAVAPTILLALATHRRPAYTNLPLYEQPPKPPRVIDVTPTYVDHEEAWFTAVDVFDRLPENRKRLQ